MKLVNLLILLMFCSIGARAVDIECQPGMLHTKIEQPGTVSTLSIRGAIDGSDIYFISSSMPSLRSLDLSKVKIVAYVGKKVGGMSQYPASTLPAGFFAGSNIEMVMLPVGCTVGDFAFSCSKLTMVSLPEGTVLQQGAFAKCENLTKVVIEPSVKLARSAFEDCIALSEVDGTKNINEIPANAFKECIALKNFNFSTSLNSVGADAFAGGGIEMVDMAGCKLSVSIGEWSFADCKNLKSVVLPKKVSRVGRGAFSACTALSDITLPENMTSLPDMVLANASKVDEIAMPSSISDIGHYAMKSMGSVDSVALPASLLTIGEGAMEGMESLVAIDATKVAEVPALGGDVWGDKDKKKVVLIVKQDLKNQFASTPQWQDFDIRDGSDTGIDLQEHSSAIRAAFVGTTLMIESNGADISSVAIYDIAGHLLASAISSGTTVLALDTSAVDGSGNVFIVSCTLDDGVKGTVKLLR